MTGVGVRDGSEAGLRPGEGAVTGRVIDKEVGGMEKRLYRSRTDVMIGGVCGGLARYLGADSTLIRLIFVALGLTGTGLLLYPAMWLIVPKEGQGESSPGDTLRSGASEMADPGNNAHPALPCGR